MKYLLVSILSLYLFNCNTSESKKRSAETIVNSSIDSAGGEIIGASTINFDFRDKHYMAFRNNGEFHFERKFSDSTYQFMDSIYEVRDAINNKGFQRFVNGLPMAVKDSMAVKYAASVNSVHYFSVLPFGLNDTAVHKELLATVSIKNNNYHTVKVTFNQEGGGEDFEDVFMYWIHAETSKVDYLAYSYNEGEGKGLRFREAYNERYIEGIRIVDYNNYKPENEAMDLEQLPQLFENGALKLLSKIVLKNVEVQVN